MLQKSLQENGKTKRNFGYIPSSLQVFLPAVKGLLADLRQRFRHAVTRIGKHCPLRFGATLPSHSGHNPALQSSPQGVGTPCASGRVDRVLLMSIDEGTKYTGLHERQLGSIENDQQLFAFLRRKYYEHKAMTPFFTVRSVALSFSEVSFPLPIRYRRGNEHIANNLPSSLWISRILPRSVFTKPVWELPAHVFPQSNELSTTTNTNARPHQNALWDTHLRILPNY